MHRRALQEAGAVLAVATLVLAGAWFSWRALPADRAVIRAKGTVDSLAPGLGSRSNLRQPYAILSLRLDDGTFVTLGRSLSCLPKLRPGDRIELAGVHSNDGGMLWRIVGEPCPL